MLSGLARRGIASSAMARNAAAKKTSPVSPQKVKVDEGIKDAEIDPQLKKKAGKIQEQLERWVER